MDVVEAVRKTWPQDKPVFVRVSGTDWVEGGWTPDDTVRLASLLSGAGVDLMDCSSGGNHPGQSVPLHPGYQVPIAERVRRETGMPTAAVGLITDPAQAAEIVAGGWADLVLLGRELLRNPYWPLRAAGVLGQDAPVPPQYSRAF
jgi:2,4-dienoyl-CoA reductase-like NADH-dependent reductase (Old Yellow Enzyme family)